MKAEANQPILVLASQGEEGGSGTSADMSRAGKVSPATGIASPVRVQLRRTKGWQMPPNTVKVCRPTIFGNPYTVEDMGRYDAVEAFRSWAGGPLWEDPHMRQDQLRLRARIPGLRGKNLGCWCRLDQACHADVLLELANADDAALAQPVSAP